MCEDDLEQDLIKLSRMLNPIREPIPEKFHRTFEGKPFDACDFCRKPLLQPCTFYMINKYYSHGELKQELAICQECLLGIRSSYSEKSVNKTMEFYPQQLIQTRQAMVKSLRKNRVARLTSRCLLCSTPKKDLQEYFEFASCDGDELIFHIYPTMQCGDCTARISRSMSDETLEIRWDFFYRHFGFPPDGHAVKHAELVMLFSI